MAEQKKTLLGVDLSHFNTVTDYDALAGAADFAVIKATQGRELSRSPANGGAYMFTDSAFPKMLDELLKRGVRCGVYHFFTASDADEAEAEAEFFIEKIKPYRGRLLFAACDVENYSNPYLLGLGRDEISEYTALFCERVLAADFRSAVYSNTDHFKNILDLSRIRHPIWTAHYVRDAQNGERWSPGHLPGFDDLPASAENALSLSAFGTTVPAMWQFTCEGSIPGVAGRVDLNLAPASSPLLTWLDAAPITPVTPPAELTLDNTPSKWAESSVKWAVNHDLIFGDENGSYNLHSACTREQLMVFLHRLVQRFVGE